MNISDRKKRLLWQVPFLCFLIAGTIYIIRQQQDAPYQHNRGAIFGTTYHIAYQSSDNLQKEILAELNKVDASLSTFNKHSIISRINRNESVEPDEMFLEVFQLAEQISKETDGAFDITVAPLVNAWGFGFKTGAKPTPNTIDSLRRIVGFKKVSYSNGRIKKQDPRMMLDCSAIAKGFGSDDALLDFGAETAAVADDFEPHAFFVHLDNLFLQRHQKQPHQKRNFIGGAAPVFGGKGKHGEIAHACVVADVADVFQHIQPFFMPHHARQKAFFRPTPVAIHNNGDMARNLSMLGDGLGAADMAHGLALVVEI